MKVYRYMSTKEFSMLTSGCTLVHTGSFMARTTSEGFCFLGENTSFVSNYGGETITLNPVACHDFLEGIVSDDVLVEMEVAEGLVTEAMGIYADPFGCYDDTIVIKEYNALQYDRETFVPLRYYIGGGVLNFGNGNWYNCN